jgi:hypothetical protein
MMHKTLHRTLSFSLNLECCYRQTELYTNSLLVSMGCSGTLYGTCTYALLAD